MKKYLTTFIILTLFTLTSFGYQKELQGELTYEITYLKLPDEMEGMESMLPKTMSIFLRGSKTLLIQQVMGGSQSIIADEATNTADILMDMMGQKIHIHMTKEELEAEEKNMSKPTFEYFSGTKKILGYKCKKAEVTDAEGEKSIVWYSPRIKFRHREYKDLNGYPLEYETSKNGTIIRTTATRLDKTKVPDERFLVPDGYTTMTMEELTKMMGEGN